ncbi:MAG: hypothetical protein A3J97_06630 [Spirochaetes bacterium RIFOXYC1_FULL_54_7]|nr:MAG: hypothetical protein A3J97_06630 [Spirochaetes bacterium RIFOXYC1_FULL_54_7]
MKPLVPFLIALAMLAAVPARTSANETVRVYGIIMESAETVQQRYAVALSMAALNDPDAAIYALDALDWVLTNRSTIRAGSERELYERLSQVLVKSLGDWRYTNAAASVMRVVDDSTDPLSRSEALIALGSMRATEYAEKIALILRDLNLAPTADRDAGEKLAYGSILALERMRSPLGFAPLFFASEGWYSRRVREQAERSLPLVLDDPTEAVAEIIEKESLERKIRAFDLLMRSRAADESKIRTAASALSRGITLSPRNKAEETLLSDLRVRSMNALVSLGDRSGNSSADFNEAYRIGGIDEKLVALRAMGATRSVESARFLRDIIIDLDGVHRRGLVDNTRETLMRAALQNAAVNARKELAPALQAVSLNQGWSGGILNLAAIAQKALQ